MKHVRITLEDEEWQPLLEAKGKQSWREFLVGKSVEK